MCISVWLHVCPCITYLQSLWKPKEDTGFTELKLQRFVTTVLAGIKVRFSEKKVSVIHYGDLFYLSYLALYLEVPFIIMICQSFYFLKKISDFFNLHFLSPFLSLSSYVFEIPECAIKWVCFLSLPLNSFPSVALSVLFGCVSVC